MDGRRAVTVSFALQIDRHAAVTVHSVVAVVDLVDLLLDFFFLSVMPRLPMFPIVIVGIWTDPQPPQQPADAEFLLMLVDEPVSL